MTVALEVRIRDLLPELLADALIILAALQAAGTVTTGTLQPLFNGIHHFLIFIQPNCHTNTSFPV